MKTRQAGAFVLLLTGTMWSAAVAAQSLLPRQLVTNGVVFGSAASGGTLYVGGQFTHVGRAVGPGVPIDITSGAIPANLPLFANAVSPPLVYAVVGDGAGGFFVGGSFETVGGLSRRNLVHLDATLAVTAWNPAPDAPVFALATGPSVLYVGGVFQNVGGAVRSGLAALDPGSGLAVAWNPSADGPVRALVATPTTVYAGGGFTAIGGQARFHVAALDASSGLATAFDASLAGGTTILALALGGTQVYVAGDFTTVGASMRAGLAAVNATTGAVHGWNPAPDGLTRALATDGVTVYAGGDFTNIGTKVRPYIAALNTTFGRASTWAPELDGSVRSLVLDGGLLYAGGQFANAGGTSHLRVAALDVSLGTPTSWKPAVGFPGGFDEVWAIARSGANLFAGGSFRTFDPQPRAGLASADLVTQEWTGWSPGAVGIVRHLAVGGGSVYVAGPFTHVGGQARAGLAALDPVSGTATTWDPAPSSPPLVLQLAGSTLYVGGSFVTIAGQSRARLAAFDTAIDALLPWDPGANADVLALRPAGSLVYVGGRFDQLGGQTRWSLGAVDATSGALTPWDPDGPTGGFDTNSQTVIFPVVRSIAVDAGTVFAGGNFIAIGGQSATNLAALDAASGVAAPWTPGGTGGANWHREFHVADLVVRPAEILVGGTFYTLGGTFRAYLGAVDRTTGLATAWEPAPLTDVFGLVDGGDVVVAVGGFDEIEDVPLRGLALFSYPTGPVGVPGKPDLSPARLALATPTPHPLAERGILSFSLPRAGVVTLELHDVAGRLRRTLLRNVPEPAGTTSLAFERAGLPSGVYLLRLSMGGEGTTRKLVVSP